MTDLATLGIRIDSSQVKTGTAELDKLTAAGARAEAAATGLGRGSKAAAAEAAAMATAAQASARAATGMATGFKASEAAMRVNTVAMRETLVVARELSRGNFTRIPGSLTLLAQGIGSQGGLKAFGAALTQTLGLVKTVQNAELAEQATQAAASAAAIESAAARAAAAVRSADTELALAEAQARVTAGTSAESAAQARLVEAHDAVAAAAAEAAIAEDALATAYRRAETAAGESAAASRTSLTGLGAALGVVGIAAGLAFAGVESFKSEVKDSGDLDHFAEGLRLTSSQIEAAGGQVKYLGHNVQEITGLTVTWGDVFEGTFDALVEAAGSSASKFKSFWSEALKETAQVGVSAAQVIAGAFAGISSIVGNLKDAGKTYLQHLEGGQGLGEALANQDLASPSKVGQQALDAFMKQFNATGKFFHETLPNDIEARARKRLQALSDRNNPAKGRPPRQKRNPADDEIAKLDAQIKGENELAQAYLTSDAAVIKAQADQKAMTLAVEKHASAAQTAALKNRELALSIATISADGAKEINNLTYEADSRKKVNDMVAAGLIPASQANNYMQMEAQLRPLIAAQSLAEGQAKATLTAEIGRLTKAYADNQAQISRGQALSQIAANDNEAAKLRLEASLIGASNRERAIALAQLEAAQQLVNMPGLSPEDQANFINSEVNKALAAVQTPWQQFAASIPQTAEAIHDAFDNIALKGVDSLAQGITDVITGAKSLKQAFKETAQSIVADIVQMIVKMLIFRALSSIFGSAFTPSSVNIGAGGAASSLPDMLSGPVAGLPGLASANGNIFLGGNVIPFANGGVVSGPTLFPMNGGRTGMMGEAGPEAIMPLTRDSSGRLGVKANDNTRGPVEVVISFGDAPDFAPYVESVSQRHAQEAVIVSVRHTNDTVRKINRPKLQGGR